MYQCRKHHVHARRFSKIPFISLIIVIGIVSCPRYRCQLPIGQANYRDGFIPRYLIWCRRACLGECHTRCSRANGWTSNSRTVMKNLPLRDKCNRCVDSISECSKRPVVLSTMDEFAFRSSIHESRSTEFICSLLVLFLGRASPSTRSVRHVLSIVERHSAAQYFRRE